jgi:hypothetical protein
VTISLRAIEVDLGAAPEISGRKRFLAAQFLPERRYLLFEDAENPLILDPTNG